MCFRLPPASPHTHTHTRARTHTAPSSLHAQDPEQQGADDVSDTIKTAKAKAHDAENAAKAKAQPKAGGDLMDDGTEDEMGHIDEDVRAILVVWCR